MGRSEKFRKVNKNLEGAIECSSIIKCVLRECSLEGYRERKQVGKG